MEHKAKAAFVVGNRSSFVFTGGVSEQDAQPTEGHTTSRIRGSNRNRGIVLRLTPWNHHSPQPIAVRCDTRPVAVYVT